MTRRAGIVLGLAILGAALVGCGSAAGRPGSGQATAEPNSPTISATNLMFDKTELDVPASRPFTLVFENQDSAPHNVAIYRAANATDALFKGEVFSGPGNRVYSVSALPAGTWFFRCDVHTDMHGTVVAAP
jgi:plastocyanin